MYCSVKYEFVVIRQALSKVKSYVSNDGDIWFG